MSVCSILPLAKGYLSPGSWARTEPSANQVSSMVIKLADFTPVVGFVLGQLFLIHLAAFRQEAGSDCLSEQKLAVAR